MVVRIEGLSYSYAGGKKALDDINLHFGQGRRTALLGVNGSGKSTLLYHLNGSKLAQQGRVQVLGLEVEKENLSEIRRKVGFLFDFPDHQLFSTTVYQDIGFALDNYRYPEEEKEELIRSVAGELGIEDLLERTPYQLSLGQKKKVAIAGIMVLEPDIIVCDEPFSGLDGYSIIYFRKILEDWLRQGRTMIFSSHDVDLIYEWADDVVVLKEGRVLKSGSVDEVMGSDDIYQKAGLVRPMLYKLFKDCSHRPRSLEEARDLVEGCV